MLALTRNGDTEYFPDGEQERAMQLYWSARKGGDSTAHLKKVPDLPPDDEPPEPPNGASGTAPSASTPTPAPSTAGTAPGTVSVIAAERIQLQETWLQDSGFSVRPPLFAPGTRVIPLGDSNFRMERQRVEEMPLFWEAAGRIIDTINEEERADFDVRLSNLEMTERGTLLAHGLEYGLEPSAFQQLALLAGFGMGARYLAQLCNPELRATNVNTQLRRAKDKTLTLRTRLGGSGDRRVFATVTPTYAAVDTDEVLRTVAKGLDDAHTELVYDGSGVRATALFMPDKVVDLAAGDVFKAGVRIETDDTGRGRIRISAVVWRNLCLNLIIIDEGSVETVSAVHRGDPGRILKIVEGGVEAAREKIDSFLEAWGHARTVKVEEPRKTFEEWLGSKKIDLPGRQDPKQTADQFMAAWEHEPGNTVADVINAMTRAAHTNRDWSLETREVLERQAGQLVYAYA